MLRNRGDSQRLRGVFMSTVPAEVLQTAAMALKLSAEKQNVYVSLNRATLIVRPTLEAVWPLLDEQKEVRVPA